MGASLGGGGGRDSRRYRKQRFTEINVTPMVDVMLVLLIIFMVAAPMLTTGLQVDLPDAKSKPIEGKDEPITVSVKNDGQIAIGQTPITLGELGPKLKAIAKENFETRIFIKGDKNVDYGKVMAVMGEINTAGFNKVAMITSPVGNQSGGSSRKEK